MQDRQTDRHKKLKRNQNPTKPKQNANTVTSGRLALNGRVVFGVHLVLRPVGKHVDEVIQVPQAVGQGPDGEVSSGKRHQVPKHSFL